MDFDTTKVRGDRVRDGNTAPRFSTGSRDEETRDEPSLVSSEDRLVIPTGSRKTAFVHLALEAWRVGLLHPKSLGEVRGRDVDEDGFRRALYRSPVTDIEHALAPVLKGRKVVDAPPWKGSARRSRS
jgi:hypothetical protein